MIKYNVAVATKRNFSDMLAQSPVALHFSGHGYENNQKFFSNEAVLHKGKGDLLLLEDESGKADYLF